MPPDRLNQELSLDYDPAAWVPRHPVACIWLGAFFLWVSASLIIRMWIVHRSASPFRRVLWSFVLLLPLFGWMAYAAFFKVPDYHNTPAPRSDDGGGWTG